VIEINFRARSNLEARVSCCGPRGCVIELNAGWMATQISNSSASFLRCSFARDPQENVVQMIV